MSKALMEYYLVVVVTGMNQISSQPLLMYECSVWGDQVGDVG
jgi:hypothetical protein